MIPVSEIIVALMIGLIAVWFVTSLGLRRDGWRFKKMTGVDLHEPGAREEVEQKLHEIVQIFSEDPTNKKVLDELVFFQRAYWRSFEL